MKKSAFSRKKRLIFPKILATIVCVGGANTNLQYHKTKEADMVTENSKSYRYEKIEEATVEKIHQIADEYIEKSKKGKNEDELYQEAYQYACNTLIERIGSAFGQGDMFWIYEIILEENFDYYPTAKNPYAVRKPRKDITDEQLSNPYNLISGMFE